MIEMYRRSSRFLRKNVFARLGCLLAFALSAASCSGPAPAGPDAERAAPATPAAAAPNANRAAMTNGGQMPYEGIEKVDPNAFNAANDNLKVIPTDANKNRLSVGERSGPDDSVISVTMNQKGEPVETRTFKSHPLIAKVEKVTIGKDPHYKIYLRDGRVLPAPADKMENFSVLAPENVLDAVGLLPKPAADANVRSGEKTAAGKQ